MTRVRQTIVGLVFALMLPQGAAAQVPSMSAVEWEISGGPPIAADCNVY